MTPALKLLDSILSQEDASQGLTGAIVRKSHLLRHHGTGFGPYCGADNSWFFCVPSCFNAALDIQQTLRAIHRRDRCNRSKDGEQCPECSKVIAHVTKNRCGPCGTCDACEAGRPCPNIKQCEFCPRCGKCHKCRYCPECSRHEVLEWTQGSTFNFTRGDTLYDSTFAYQGDWNAVLTKFRNCIEVIEASPAVPGRLPPKGPAKSDQSRSRYPGKLSFKLYIHNVDEQRISACGIYTVSQDEFIRLLISGKNSHCNLTLTRTHANVGTLL